MIPGHYIVNDKIFCETHALAAKSAQQPPLLQQTHGQIQSQQPKVQQNSTQQVNGGSFDCS
jgi:hypothetical protein